MPDTDVLVSELTQASAIDTNDLMLMTQPDAESQTGYASRKGTVLQVATKVLKNTEYTTDLPDFTDKTIIGALKELKADTKPVKTATGNPCTFDTDLADNLVSLTAEIVASGGGGTPSTPIPINGYTEANITRCGVNLFDKNAFVNTYSSNFSIESDGSIYSSNYSSVLNNTIWENVTGKSGSFTITFISKYSTSGGSVGLRPNVIYTDGTSETIQPTNTQTYLTTTFTTSASKTVDKIVVDYGSSTYPTYFYLQVEVGSTANAYQDYNGQTYTIAFGQTVYGGVLDVTRGKLTVKTLYKTYNGSENWQVGSAQSGKYRILLNEVLDNVVYPTSTSEDLDCICNMFVKSNAEDTYRLVNGISYQPNYGLRIYSSSYDTSDITLWKTLLANTPLEVVYKLTTPFDIDLTPVQISALVGTNNITSDLGGDVVVRYADGQLARDIIDLVRLVINENA